MRSIKAILFDLDGVLVDTRSLHATSFLNACTKWGLTLSADFHLDFLDGLSTKQKLAKLCSMGLLKPEIVSAIEAEKQQQSHLLLNHEIQHDSVIQGIFRDLRFQGYQLGVCTNSVRASMELCLERLGVRSTLDLALCNEDVVAPKPDPMIYHTAFRRLGLKPQECLIVEDSPRGLEAAEASGAKVLRVMDVADFKRKFREERADRIAALYPHL